MNTISYNTNNGNTLKLTQAKHDGEVILTSTTSGETVINPGDMVMLMNFYRYIKENDIQNDFINPNGKNKEN